VNLFYRLHQSPTRFPLLVMLGGLLLLSAVCWSVYYLVAANPFSLGILFALLLTGLQLYLVWRMIGRGEVRARGAKRRRRRLLPFLYGKRPIRAARLR